MASKKVQDLIDQLMVALEEEATEALQERLRSVLGSSAKELAPVKRRKTTKGYTVLRPCPIPECKEIAAPRYQMVCKGHSETLSREEILVARDNANKPGGAWADLKPGRKVA